MSFDSKVNTAEQAGRPLDRTMDPLKTFFHLNNWLYHSVMEKWHGFMALIHHISSKFHELRYRYHTWQVERADAKIKKMLSNPELEKLLKEIPEDDK